MNKIKFKNSMFYVINKPKGISSFFALKKIKYKFQINKIWHCGTLDPLAEWLLFVATDNSTKLLAYLDKQNKTYYFEMSLDWFTETWDLGSEINFLDKKFLIEKSKTITLKKINTIIKKYFFWKIKQVPHKYSAININWKRAYNLSRENEKFEILPKERTIFSYKIIDFEFPKITIEMEVSSWTYIRSIAEDLWKKLWAWWYVTKLIRTRFWNLYLSEAKNIEEIKITDNIWYNIIFPWFKNIELDETNINQIKNWIILKNIFNLKEWEKYFIKNNNQYISLVEVKNNNLVILRNNIT